MPTAPLLTSTPSRPVGVLQEPEQPLAIAPVDIGTQWSGVDCEAALAVLASNKNALEATAMDSETLHKRLATPWSAESALKNCEP